METRAKSRKRNNGPDFSAFFTPMGLLKWAAVILMLVFLATRFGGKKESSAAFPAVAEAVKAAADRICEDNDSDGCAKAILSLLS